MSLRKVTADGHQHSAYLVTIISLIKQSYISCPKHRNRTPDVELKSQHDIKTTFIHSFISFHSGHFYSAPSSPLLLKGAPDYSTDTVSEFHAEAHMQLQVKDLPKVPTWRLERESNPRPSDNFRIIFIHSFRPFL